MARPRTPAKVLELRGAFQHDPQRRRRDAEGAGPLDREPPAHLPRDVVPAWHWIVVRLPLAALSSSDEIAIEAAARLLGEVWSARRPDPRLFAELRHWLRELGMTVQARTQIPAMLPPPPPPAAESANRFTRLKP